MLLQRKSSCCGSTLSREKTGVGRGRQGAGIRKVRHEALIIRKSDVHRMFVRIMCRSAGPGPRDLVHGGRHAGL